MPFSTRRDFLKLSAALATSSLLGRPAFSKIATEVPLHGLSAFGDLKYPRDFTQFDYANTKAPKGGTFRFQPGYWYYNQNVSTFNTMNTFVRTGDAPPRMELCFDSLMTGAWDEPDSRYGLVAETVMVSADRNVFSFQLRKNARFHDGSPLTAEDVVFSYQLLKEKGHPQLSLVLSEMVAAEAVGEHKIRLVFSGKQSDLTVLAAVQFPILSKKSLEDKEFNSAGLTPLLGSGPYKVGRFSAGRYIEYDRVEDYWARDLPVVRGLFHFDRIRIDFFRDRTAAFEAFKKGEVMWREEFTSRLWATAYDFPALQEGKVVKREFAEERVPEMQGWALNQRRDRFRDPRVREAIGLCFDFEWTNRNFFYGLYERSVSLFEKSDFKAAGMPSQEELAILERFRRQIPDAVFGEAVVPPTTTGSGRDRKLFGLARELFMEAGWHPRDGVLHNERGERFTLEYLVQDQVFEQLAGPFLRNLRSIGIDASIRVVDASQYQLRLSSFDFDMVGVRFSLGATPTRDSLELVFHSRSATVEGSRNLPGTADPAIDGIIEIAGQATTREELATALRALDRVLRARRDWIPNWHSPSHRVAYWDLFNFKEPKPDYFFPVEALWWYDEEKARAIGRA